MSSNGSQTVRAAAAAASAAAVAEPMRDFLLPASAPSPVHQLALTLLPGIGPKLTRQLVAYCGSAENVLKAGAARLLRVPGIGPTLAAGVSGASAALREAEQLLRRCEQEQVRILWYENPDFPQRLRLVPDAPALLYCQGTVDLDAPRAVALVGTRQATDYGRRAVEQLVNGLKSTGATIVSGLAYGIDIFAHRAALEAGLPTVAALAGGLDRLYPAEHRRTANRMIAEGGGLLTEYPFGVKPMKLQFPARNRVIAGLSDATVVIEAAARGGALITADLAQDYDRAVLAVPGDIFAPWSAGCNQYIRDLKATPCLSADDITVALNWDGALSPVAATRAGIAPVEPELNPDDYTPDEAIVLRALLAAPERTDHIDGLSWRTGLPMGLVSSVLLTLELAGLVAAQPGKVFRLLL